MASARSRPGIGAVPPSKRAATSAAFTEKRARVRPPWSQPGQLGSTSSNLVVNRRLALVAVAAGADPLDRRGERAGHVLDAERVGVAGELERRALVTAGGGPAGDRALAGELGDRREHLVEVGEDAGHRRSGQRAGEVAVLAVGRAAAGQVDAPVRARRDGLRLAGARRRDDEGQRRLRPRVRLALGRPLRRARPGRRPRRPRRPAAVDAAQDLGGVRELARGPHHEHAAREPAADAGRLGAGGGRVVSVGGLETIGEGGPASHERGTNVMIYAVQLLDRTMHFQDSRGCPDTDARSGGRALGVRALGGREAGPGGRARLGSAARSGAEPAGAGRAPEEDVTAAPGALRTDGSGAPRPPARPSPRT